jgi:hypothetical protein
MKVCSIPIFASTLSANKVPLMLGAVVLLRLQKRLDIRGVDVLFKFSFLYISTVNSDQRLWRVAWVVEFKINTLFELT